MVPCYYYFGCRLHGGGGRDCGSRPLELVMVDVSHSSEEVREGPDVVLGLRKRAIVYLCNENTKR